MSSRVAKVRTNLIFCCGNAGGADAEKKNHLCPQGSHVQLCRLRTAILLGVLLSTTLLGMAALSGVMHSEYGHRQGPCKHPLLSSKKSRSLCCGKVEKIRGKLGLVGLKGSGRDF